MYHDEMSITAYESRKGDDGMSKGLMYCVSCCRILPVMESYTLYRTGFYKHNVPAGMCKECQAGLSEDRK